jgi:hypothetical protein
LTDKRNLSNHAETQERGCCTDKLEMNPISSLVASANVPSAQASGLAAIAGGNQRLSQDAQQIANPDSQNVTASLLDLNRSLLLAEAGANVISAENQMLGALLDVLA